MSIKVKLNSILQKHTGGQEVIEVTGHTVGECLENLESRFPDIKQETRNKQGRLVPYCYFFVNSKCALVNKLTPPVNDGDEIEIKFLAAGG